MPDIRLMATAGLLADIPRENNTAKVEKLRILTREYNSIEGGRLYIRKRNGHINFIEYKDKHHHGITKNISRIYTLARRDYLEVKIKETRYSILNTGRGLEESMMDAAKAAKTLELLLLKYEAAGLEINRIVCSKRQYEWQKYPQSICLMPASEKTSGVWQSNTGLHTGKAPVSDQVQRSLSDHAGDMVRNTGQKQLSERAYKGIRNRVEYKIENFADKRLKVGEGIKSYEVAGKASGSDQILSGSDEEDTSPDFKGLVYPTRNGVYMRSEEERIIGNLMEEMGIAYRYEPVVEMAGLKYYPSFGVMLDDGSLVLIEFFGKLRDGKCQSGIVKRMAAYSRAGIETGKNLFIIFDTDIGRADRMARVLKQAIEAFGNCNPVLENATKINLKN